jgi:hypothetical protein
MPKLNTPSDIIAAIQGKGYTATEKDSLLIIQDEDEVNIFTVMDESQIEFMVDLCGLDELDTTKLVEIYEKLLDENTEILPTCFGVDSDDPNNKRIVLVDSLAVENLDENELLLSLDSLTVNVATAHDLLSPYFKS